MNAVFDFTDRTVIVTGAARGIGRALAQSFVESNADRRQEFEGLIPIGRFARPVEITAAVRFLAADEAAYITGTILPVDSGMAM